MSSGPARRAVETAGFEPTRAAIAQACELARADDGSVTFANSFEAVIARA